MRCSQEKAQSPQSGQKTATCPTKVQNEQSNKRRSKTAARLGGIKQKLKGKVIYQIEFLRQRWFRAREAPPLSILQSCRPNIKSSSGAHNWWDIYVGSQLRAYIQPHLPGALRTREAGTGNTFLVVLQGEGQDQPQQPDPPAPKHHCNSGSNSLGFPRTSARCSHSLQLLLWQTPKNPQTQALKSLFAVQKHKQLPSHTRLWNL